MISILTAILLMVLVGTVIQRADGLSGLLGDDASAPEAEPPAAPVVALTHDAVTIPAEALARIDVMSNDPGLPSEARASLRIVRLPECGRVFVQAQALQYLSNASCVGQQVLSYGVTVDGTELVAEVQIEVIGKPGAPAQQSRQPSQQLAQTEAEQPAPTPTSPAETVPQNPAHAVADPGHDSAEKTELAAASPTATTGPDAGRSAPLATETPEPRVPSGTEQDEGQSSVPNEVALATQEDAERKTRRRKPRIIYSNAPTRPPEPADPAAPALRDNSEVGGSTIAAAPASGALHSGQPSRTAAPAAPTVDELAALQARLDRSPITSSRVLPKKKSHCKFSKDQSTGSEGCTKKANWGLKSFIKCSIRETFSSFKDLEIIATCVNVNILSLSRLVRTC